MILELITSERRKHSRNPESFPAVIESRKDGLLLHCVVSAMSIQGASITADSIALPNQFILVMPWKGAQLRLACSVVRRNDFTVGVRFGHDD